VPMTELSPNEYEAELPAVPCAQTIEYYFQAESSGAGTVTDPANAPDSLYSALSVVELIQVADYDFEADAGWTTASFVDSGAWEREVPITNCDRGNPLADFDGSGACWLTENNAGDCDSDVDNGTTTLLSPIFDLSGLQNPEVSYARWYSNVEGGGAQADVLEVEVSQHIKRRTEEAEQRAKELATEHVARAIQRYAAEHTADTTTAKVTITDDDMKGRIIGKEGRNIRTFEQQTGVDLIIDDTPGIITISCFDGIRREIARCSLEELIEDGRIHPGRIEEVVARTQQDLDRHVLELGEDAAYECDCSGLHPALLKLLGKLNFRTSYGQNVLQHTKEVAWLTGALAADLGLDSKLGRRCGLMHDIGKALDHEQEGSHPELGYEALKRYNENETVANAALAHHEGREVLTVYTVLTAAADAISAARPGARRESLERYIKRLEALEDIACSFTGVRKSYAIQAGRELRVIVNEHSLPDNVLPKTARSIARRIEDEVAYPGEVKVTLIRETRQTAVAR